MKGMTMCNDIHHGNMQLHYDMNASSKLGQVSVN